MCIHILGKLWFINRKLFWLENVPGRSTGSGSSENLTAIYLLEKNQLMAIIKLVCPRGYSIEILMLEKRNHLQLFSFVGLFHDSGDDILRSTIMIKNSNNAHTLQRGFLESYTATCVPAWLRCPWIGDRGQRWRRMGRSRSSKTFWWIGPPERQAKLRKIENVKKQWGRFNQSQWRCKKLYKKNRIIFR
jgi:hypothetical protein